MVISGDLANRSRLKLKEEINNPPLNASLLRATHFLPRFSPIYPCIPPLYPSYLDLLYKVL